MLPKLNAWREALREYSAINLTAKGNPKHDHIVPVGQYVKQARMERKSVFITTKKK